MSDDSKKDEKKRSGSDTARRIWLAGIGAYGRAFSEAQGALKDVTGEASDVFDSLVQKGEVIEMAVQTKRKGMMSKVGVPDLDMSDRIEKMRSRLQRGSESADLSSVHERLDAIEAKLDKILAAQKPAKKPPSSRTRTTRNTTKKT